MLAENADLKGFKLFSRRRQAKIITEKNWLAFMDDTPEFILSYSNKIW